MWHLLSNALIRYNLKLLTVPRKVLAVNICNGETTTNWSSLDVTWYQRFALMIWADTTIFVPKYFRIISYYSELVCAAIKIFWPYPFLLNNWRGNINQMTNLNENIKMISPHILSLIGLCSEFTFGYQVIHVDLRFSSTSI